MILSVGVGDAPFNALPILGSVEALTVILAVQDATQQNEYPVCGFLTAQLANHRARKDQMFTFIAWLVLFVLCWPVALLALVLWPVVWLFALPFRLVGITFEALFALLRTILFLPARVLGHKPK